MRLTTAYLRRLTPLLDYYGHFHPSVLSIQQFMDFGAATASEKKKIGAKNASEQKSYLFLRKELLVRLANIMNEINLLPIQLLSMPSVQIVEGWYEQSFSDIIHFDKLDHNDPNVLLNFTEVLTMVRNRHSQVVETMAQGVIEMKESGCNDSPTLEGQIQYFLDRFYMSRISIRMLINQHTLLFGGDLPEVTQNQQHIGCIDPYCNVLNIAKDAFEDARFLCEQYYMMSPDIELNTHNPYENVNQIMFHYVPSHLYHIMFELFKNALRAVVEFHGDQVDVLPKIKVMICKGSEDLTIKLSDQGGGIPRNVIDLLFNYMYSTAPRPPSPSAASSTPLAGYGYGLPLSRLYAKYFNGDLMLNSVEGYGTDAVIYLKVFPADASELLPVYNKTSVSKYSSSMPVGDWSDSSHTQGLHGAVHQVGHITQNRQFSTGARKKPTLPVIESRRHQHTWTLRSPLFIRDCFAPAALSKSKAS